MISSPLIAEAIKRYPPRFNITVNSVKIGHQAFDSLDSQSFSYAYQHQLPITFDVISAEKFLGDELDPIQIEAEKIVGSQGVIKPPEFPPAQPYSISVGNEVFYDYLLLRATEYLDDGRLIVTNENQKNRSIDVRISLNFISKKTTISFKPLNQANEENLRYLCFTKKALDGDVIRIKNLPANKILAEGHANKFTKKDTLDEEILFLGKIVEIEKYFKVAIQVPSQISLEDIRTINHVYEIIKKGSFTEKWFEFDITFEISDATKRAIEDWQDDATYFFELRYEVHIDLFNVSISLPLKREMFDVHILDLKKTKRKAKILDDGESIIIKFKSANGKIGSSYIDTLISDDNL